MDAETPPGIAVVDDHQLVGLAVLSALHAHSTLRFAGTFPTVDDLLAAADRPRLVLLDLRLADGSSPVTNVERLRESGCDVLAFTSAEDAYLVRQVLHTDVLGLLRKSAPVATIVAAIEGAVHGEPVVTSEWAHALESDPLIADAGLSRQEARVLQLFADGASAQSVAERLFITVGTLEDYLRRIRAKYTRVGRPAPTKVDLYKRAVEDGLLPGPSGG